MTKALPLPLEPLPDETWDSYLTRRASQHDCTVATLADRLGLRGPRGRWPGHYGVTITSATAERVATDLRLSPEQIQRMHLSRYDQLALDLKGLSGHKGGIATTRMTAHAAWVWLAGSTYCPQCLAETGGAWRLRWRIPWITTCLEHRTALLGTCPTCTGVPGLGNQFNTSAPTRMTIAPDGRLCSHPLTGGRVCGANLSTADPPPVGAERLARTRLMNDLAEGHRGMIAGIGYTSLQSLRAWQSAIGIASRLGVVDTRGWGRTHRWANPPRDPELIDALLASVEPLLGAPTVVEAAEKLQAWCRGAGITSPHSGTFTRITRPAAALQPVLDELLAHHGRAHTRLQRLTTDDDAEMMRWGWDVDDIPQVVWPCALPERLRRSSHPDHRLLRTVLAIMLARVRSGAPDWVAAGAHLGFPANKSRCWTRYVCADRWGLKSDLVASAAQLSEQLASQPVAHTWWNRGGVDGHGAHALRRAQQPPCRAESPNGLWCPCSGPDAHSPSGNALATGGAPAISELAGAECNDFRCPPQRPSP